MSKFKYIKQIPDEHTRIIINTVMIEQAYQLKRIADKLTRIEKKLSPLLVRGLK